MARNNVNDEDVIPSWKIKKAYEICMKDPKLAKYFNDVPAGARQYIALEFYCTVFSGEVNDNLCVKYQQEVEEDLTREDVRYLAENDPNSAFRVHFVNFMWRCRRRSRRGMSELLQMTQQLLLQKKSTGNCLKAIHGWITCLRESP